MYASVSEKMYFFCIFLEFGNEMHLVGEYIYIYNLVT